MKLKTQKRGFLLLAFSFWSFGFVIMRTESGAKIHWKENPHYSISVENLPSDTCMPDVIPTLQDAFTVWNNIPYADIQAIYDGTTTTSVYCSENGGDQGCDGKNIIVFKSLGDDATLGFTVNYYNAVTGEMQEADMVFNLDLKWADDPVNGPPECQGQGRYRLLAVGVHEAGHFFGLDHSFTAYLGADFDPKISATMYPFYFKICEQDQSGEISCQDDSEEALSLEQDDIAGITLLYPDTAQSPGWGEIQGSVLEGDSPLFGVHIVAIRSSDLVPVVARLTGKAGGYRLFGLPPDEYYLYCESPQIAGKLFKAYLFSYWKSVNQVPYVQLYSQVQVEDYSQLAPGSTIFSRAKKVRLSSSQKKSGIDFIYPGESSDDGCGCLLYSEPKAFSRNLDISLILVSALFFGLLLYRWWRAQRV